MALLCEIATYCDPTVPVLTQPPYQADARPWAPVATPASVQIDFVGMTCHISYKT
jgi:hypothetical protein